MVDPLKLITRAVKLAGNILEIIAENGDDAADFRLGDIDGFGELKDEVTNEAEAVRRFREKLAARDDG